MSETVPEAAPAIVAWDGPAIGLLDLDAFFASVEQLDHPEWRGKPVIVGGSAESRGVVSTASYEARRFGVRSAMPAATARRLCPQAQWTHGNFPRYREVSARVMSIIGDETPRVERVSIDEAFFDVSPGRFSHESPVAICCRIQQRVAELGVTCSIGLGVCKTVAKIASEREKPRGLTVVPPGTEAAFLAPLPVGDMSGIGPATRERLARLGIRTLGELARADANMLEREFGVLGPRMALRAAGLERGDVSEAAATEEAKSVSNERTFPVDLVARSDVERAIRQISELVARRLRAKGLRGRTITLKLKFDLSHTRSAQKTLTHRTDDGRRIGEVACELLDGIWSEGTRVRLAGVGASSFDEGSCEQLSLFDGEDENALKQGRDLSALGRATDAVRERFGEKAVAYGREFRLARDAGGGEWDASGGADRVVP